MEYTRAFHLLERSFFCEGGTNKKTHFKSHVLASPVQLPNYSDGINHAITFAAHGRHKPRRHILSLDKSSQSGDCGEANVMALHLASKQVMPLAFAVKGIPFGYSLTQVKAQSNCIRAGSFLPFPSCHASGTPDGSSTASTHNPYKEVILSREAIQRRG